VAKDSPSGVLPRFLATEGGTGSQARFPRCQFRFVSPMAALGSPKSEFPTEYGLVSEVIIYRPVKDQNADNGLARFLPVVSRANSAFH